MSTAMCAGYRKRSQVRCRTLGHIREIRSTSSSFYARKEEALKITEDLKDCVITSWNPEAVDVTSKKAGKAEGIRRMMEMYGIRQDEVMAFGDGENDIDMIEFAGIGVAMGKCRRERETLCGLCDG